MDNMLVKVAKTITLWIGYSGVLDTMPPHDPDDPRNEAWIEANFRPFLTASAFAIKVMRKGKAHE